MLTRLRKKFDRALKRRRPLDHDPEITNDRMIFICGLHRSGTSVLHRVMQESQFVTGLSKTGVPEDEGQHVQSVFKPALAFGGPGRFAFDPASAMTEADAVNIQAERGRLLREWGAYLDLGRPFVVEKSPPNLVRSRYFQALFPRASFIFIVRHPIPVSLATEKWARTTHLELMLHWQAAHLLMLRDLPFLERALVVRYEDMTDRFDEKLAEISAFVGLDRFESRESMSDRSEKYFDRWEKSRRIDIRLVEEMMGAEGGPMYRFGYRLTPPYTMPIIS